MGLSENNTISDAIDVLGMGNWSDGTPINEDHEIVEFQPQLLASS